MRINTNISAMNTYSRLTAANNSKSGSLAKLSSGLRINKAGDDAAGLSISEKMKNQISGLTQATRNAQDAISLIQTAEGGLNETHSILNRMRDLAVQASTDTNTLEDRKEIQKELEELSEELTRIGDDTQFNTKVLMNGDFGTTELTFHIGANESQNLKLNISDMRAEALGVNIVAKDEVESIKGAEAAGPAGSNYTAGTATADDIKGLTGLNGYTGVANVAAKLDADDNIVALDIAGDGTFYAVGNIKVAGDTTALEATDAGVVWTDDTPTPAPGDAVVKGAGINLETQEGADRSITIIDKAIELVSAERSKLGATQNRLDHTINNLTATAENLSEAESRIRDVDMAQEMMEFTKSNILSQAATAMLAQANQMPQGVLQLLQ